MKRKLVAFIAALMVGITAAPTVANATEAGHVNTWVDFEHHECSEIENGKEEKHNCFAEEGKEAAKHGWRKDFEKSTAEGGFGITSTSNEAELKPFHEWLEAHVNLMMASYNFNLVREWFYRSNANVLMYTDELCTEAPLTEENKHREAIRKEIEKWNENIEGTEKKYKLKGVFLDDANYGQAEGHKCGTNEAHEQKPGIENKEWTTLIGELRTKYGSSFIIAFNDQYEHYKQYVEFPEGKVKITNATFREAVEKSTIVHQEFGIGNLTTLAEYEEYIKWASTLPEKYTAHTTLAGNGKPIEQAIIKGESATQTQLEEYELATYLLASDGSNYVGSYYRASDTPSKFWQGWCGVNHSPCETADGNLTLPGTGEKLTRKYVLPEPHGAYIRLFNKTSEPKYTWAFVQPPENATGEVANALDAKLKSTEWKELKEQFKEGASEVKCRIESKLELCTLTLVEKHGAALHY